MWKTEPGAHGAREATIAHPTCSPTLMFLLAVAGSSLLFCLACSDSTSASSQRLDQISGELKVVVVEGEGAEAGPRFFLNRDDGKGVLRLSFDDPSELGPRAHLLLRGFEQDGGFRVLDYERLSDDAATAEQALTGQSLIKSRTVSFGIVDYFARGVQNGIAEKARSFMYGTTNAGPTLGVGTGDKSVRQYYDETSYGMFRLSEGNAPGVEGPFPYSGAAACGDSNCDTLATKLTPSLSQAYDHHIWFYGTTLPECDGGYGWGSQGTWLKPERDIWFNGDVFDGAITHELGHNFGFQHASSIACPGLPLADDPTRCTTVEYGNTVSIMGNLGNGHMSGLEKWYAGWLLGCNGVRVRSSGTFTLFPLETPCNGIQTLQVPMPKTTRRFNTDQSMASNPLKYYYLELRSSQGLDSDQKNQIMVHASDDIKPQTSWCARNVLLDMRPSSARSIEGMVAGESFTDPAGGVIIEVNSLTPTKASVTVTLTTSSGPNTCIDGTELTGSGPASCVAGSGGSPGSGGTTNTGGAPTMGGASSSPGSGGSTASGKTSGGASSSMSVKPSGASAGTGGTSSASTRSRTTASRGGSGFGTGGRGSTDASLNGGTNSGNSTQVVSSAPPIVGGARSSSADNVPTAGGASASSKSVAKGGTVGTSSSTAVKSSPPGSDAHGAVAGGSKAESSSGVVGSAVAEASDSEEAACSCRLGSQHVRQPGLDPRLTWLMLGFLAVRCIGGRSRAPRAGAPRAAPQIRRG